MGARATGSAVVSAPNMLGDLLFGSHTVSFGFTRVNGTTNFVGLGSTSMINSNVDENNSPLTADRVYFRYNYFNNGPSVTGLSPNSFTVPLLPGQPGPPASIQLPQTKYYDFNQYTFGVEKTFLDGLCSVEVRAPVITSLAPDNLISVGSPTGPPGTNGNFNVQTTPEDTLGHSDTYFGDMTVILKAMLYTNESSGLFVSAGMGVGIPSGPNTQVQVIDYGASANVAAASEQRLRDVLIADETWSVSPFVAALYTPNERFFTEGFLSLEDPLNSSRITYNDRFLIAPPGTPSSTIDNYTTHISEQTLLHLDWSTGFWLYRAPNSGGWITGIAPSFEVHYTSTLDNAAHAQLPGNPLVLAVNPNNPIQSIQTGKFVPDPGVTVGAVNSKENIVDLTLGTTFVLGDRAMLAAAFTVPATNDTNKTFAYEFQLQFNYYFGGSR